MANQFRGGPGSGRNVACHGTSRADRLRPRSATRRREKIERRRYSRLRLTGGRQRCRGRSTNRSFWTRRDVVPPFHRDSPFRGPELLAGRGANQLVSDGYPSSSIGTFPALGEHRRAVPRTRSRAPVSVGAGSPRRARPAEGLAASHAGRRVRRGDRHPDRPARSLELPSSNRVRAQLFFGLGTRSS